MIESKADHEESVAALYQDTGVVESYLARRFSHSWSRLLHRSQVAAVNAVIAECRPELVVELAPGPARIATALRGVQRGIMVEFSEEMLRLAERRLEAAALKEVWEVRRGNAFDLVSSPIPCDFLYTFRFVRHFEVEERLRLYRGFRASLAPGGLLMFDVVNRVVRAKLDAREPVKLPGELPVYDVTYTPEEFKAEMAGQGFEVVRMIPTIAHIGVQSWISYKVDHRIRPLSRLMVHFIERIPSTNPLEWIALCRHVG